MDIYTNGLNTPTTMNYCSEMLTIPFHDSILLQGTDFANASSALLIDWPPLCMRARVQPYI